MARNEPNGPMKRRFWPVFRVAVLGLIVYLIHNQYEASQARSRAGTDSMPLDKVQAFFPGAVRLRSRPDPDGGWTVENREGRDLGRVLQSAPDSDSIVGFSGPNNVLIAFGPDNRILGWQVLNSGDTPEHVRRVQADTHFMRSFTGLTEDQARTHRQVEAVSGATLTSLAIVEGILRRLHGESSSLQFPEAITLAEAGRFFPGAAKIDPWPERPALKRVFDGAGRLLGMITRTAPAADHVIGYQGPTDALLALDASGRVIKGVALRRSFDNQPYVRYVSEDDFFLTLFNGKTLEEMAGLDLKAAEVEGVSGATMTSQAVAKGLIQTAQALTAPPAAAPGSGAAIFRLRDLGTLLVLAGGIVMAFTHLRGKRGLRMIFQLVLIGYLGFLNGDMVSQALLAGWAKSGWPSTRAPGLLCLTLAALILPLTTRRQVYCHHLCPHGAAQQWLHRVSPWRVRLPSFVRIGLSVLPGLLLAWVLFVIMVPLPFSLVSIEPFDAYVLRVAGWATLTVAGLGLLAALFIPMAYCRYGCPTGALLNFLWASGNPHRFNRRDGAALGLVLLALSLRWVT
jgi:NosR/NirI family transcriptional regulator, nitrous oxide reductase regulator